MIQGTMSNAGKSLIAAGLCRIFRQDGYRVAPFKSQNMALNSFITDEGLEMGRAQVVQAEAAGVKPSVLMNPILLKPTTDVGSQVIINGKVSSNMTAREYYRHKKVLIPVVKEAYEKLASEYDIIVIEGAGSPAEVNLRDDDIVNMGMAELADAPVLLVGDIDRGGVFAQLYGTIALLEEHEQARIKGLIINKFRGDKTILDPGLDILKEKTDKDILGVVPYMDVVIDDEDSLSDQLRSGKYIRKMSGPQIYKETEGGNGNSLEDVLGDDNETMVSFPDIAVIRLPRISNFTDFTALSMEPEVSLRYVSNVRELGEPDVIIIPGTKSTIRDMEWLRATGLEAKLMQKHHAGTLIIGICGGYQMLGERIIDEKGAETGIGTETKGLGLLPVVTEFAEEKTRTRVTFELQGLGGSFETLNGKTVSGYEIHMGKTGDIAASNGLSVDALKNEQTETTEKEQDFGNCLFTCCDNVLGTYVHGFFDSDELRKAFLDIFYRKKGINPDKIEISERSYREFKEEQYDKLAAILRDSLDMEKIYSMIL
ncbi:cobyric acid synthase [Oribacterium sp. FC2011]|uniref:cobyric acid synthase n=1 Tax=Oribacterium sp. FC2011 TaxID=1408311 RepID=UPI0004E0B9B2